MRRGAKEDFGRFSGICGARIESSLLQGNKIAVAETFSNINNLPREKYVQDMLINYWYPIYRGTTMDSVIHDDYWQYLEIVRQCDAEVF